MRREVPTVMRPKSKRRRVEEADVSVGRVRWLSSGAAQQHWKFHSGGGNKRRQLGTAGEIMMAKPTKSTSGNGDFGVLLGRSGLEGFGDDGGCAPPAFNLIVIRLAPRRCLVCIRPLLHHGT